jgi:hypothetical protein
MQRKYLLIMLFLVLAFSCKKDNNKVSFFDLSLSEKIEVCDTIIRFDDKNPIALSLSDSMVFVIFAQEDTCVRAFSLYNDKTPACIARKGHGPNELIEPSFISTINETTRSVYLEDVYFKKLLKIEKDNNNNFTLSKFANYPHEIFPSSNLCFGNDYFVGRQIGAKYKMFYIYNQTTQHKIEVDYYPLIKDVADKNYFCATNIAFNCKAKKIISGMYFLDMCSLYDIDGKILKSVCFSEKYIPTINRKNKVLDLSNGYSGIIGMFPTVESCYLLRMTELPISENEDYTGTRNHYKLIKMDWEGNILKSYSIEDEIQGQFFIDEINKKFYTIRQVINLGGEFYDIVTYNID